jgi:hypothetical protein
MPSDARLAASPLLSADGTIASATPRRTFFRQGLLAAAALAAGPSLKAAEQPGSLRLQPALDQRLFRVRAELEVKGNVNLAKNSLTSKQRDRQLPLQANSLVDFEERVRRSGPLATAAERYYYEAESQATIGGADQKAQLRDNIARVLVHSQEGRSVIYAEDEYLTHQEIDLLRLPANSLAIDELLPRTALAVGGSYEIPPESLRRLLDLDGIQEAEVSGELTGADAERAQLQLKGKVLGSVEGVATTIDLAAKLSFDRRRHATTWLAMAMRERRDIGKAEPGFEVAATLKMIRQPLEKPHAIRQPIKLPPTPPAERLLIDLTSRQAHWGTLMDRRWRIVSDTPGLTTLRMIDSDRSIAQCDVRLLAPFKSGEQLTLQALRGDVHESLGKQFGEFLQAEQGVNSSDLRILSLSASGAVQGIPMHWIFVHCSDDSGRRLLATFSLEAEKVNDFAGADVQFAGAVHFRARPMRPTPLAPPESSDEPTPQPDAQSKQVAENASAAPAAR